jgi:hypothetical protein
MLKWLGVSACAVACLAGCGNMSSTSQSDPATSAQVEPASARAAVSAATGADASVLQKIIDGMTPGFIAAAEAAKPPAIAQADGSDQWVYFTLPASPAAPVASVRSQWQAALVAGAYREAVASSSGNPQGYSIRNVMPDGSPSEEDEGGDFRFPESAQAPSDSTSADSAEAQISLNVEKLGYRLESFSVETPAEVAPVVVVQLDASAEKEVLANGMDLEAVFGSPLQYEGVYLEAVDQQENPIAVYAISTRLGQTIGWQDPALAHDAVQ